MSPIDGVTRRQYLGALAAGAAANWDAAEYDIENVDEWGDRVEHVEIGSFDPASFRSSGDLGCSGYLVENQDVERPTAEVWYDGSGVALTLEAALDGGDYSGAVGEFTPEEARELAVAVYQAAEELEQWREATDDGA